MSEVEHRTAITRLVVPQEDRALLERTISEWKRACNLAVEQTWGTGVTDSQTVQSMTYDALREETSLKSQHVVLATRQAAEAMRSTVEQCGTDANSPTFTAPTVRYDSRTMTLFENGSISLATTDSRVRCDLALPEVEGGYQYRFLDDDEWCLSESTLTKRDGSFYLHLGFRRTASGPETTTEDGRVLGVDLGIENIAVTSTAQFFSGNQLRHNRDEFEKVRKKLLETGTRSARRTLSQAGGRERRHVRDALHIVSKCLVQEALRYDCSVIAFESLSGIEDRLPDESFFQRWAFGILRRFVDYKARRHGITTVEVDPSYTSQRCADCGHVEQENRANREQFHCQRCGSTAQADYNAAKNIGLRCVRHGPLSSCGTGASRCALKSGTVSADGEFERYPNSSGV